MSLEFILKEFRKIQFVEALIILLNHGSSLTRPRLFERQPMTMSAFLEASSRLIISLGSWFKSESIVKTRSDRRSTSPSPFFVVDFDSRVCFGEGLDLFEGPVGSFDDEVDLVVHGKVA